MSQSQSTLDIVNACLKLVSDHLAGLHLSTEQFNEAYGNVGINIVGWFVTNAKLPVCDGELVVGTATPAQTFQMILPVLQNNIAAHIQLAAQADPAAEITRDIFACLNASNGQGDPSDVANRQSSAPKSIR